jgi:hypothetical protein
MFCYFKPTLTTQLMRISAQKRIAIRVTAIQCARAGFVAVLRILHHSIRGQQKSRPRPLFKEIAGGWANVATVTSLSL